MAGDYVDGDVIFDTQFLALKRAIEGNGILTGIAFTPGPGAMQVQWTAGTWYANNIKQTTPGSNTTIAAADPTHDRWDLIHSSGSGVSKITGTPAAAPQMPDLPANEIILALVYVPATTVTITAGMIRDMAFTTPLQDHIQDTTIHYTKPIAEADITFAGAGHDHSGGASGNPVDYSDLDSIPATFLATIHGLGDTARHSSATLAQLNALISDGTVVDTGDSRFSDARTPLSHDHTKHSDRVRNMQIPDFLNGSRYPTSPTAPLVYGNSFPSTSTEGYAYQHANTGTYSRGSYGKWNLPKGALGEAASWTPVVKILYCAQTTGSGNMHILVNMKGRKDGVESTLSGDVVATPNADGKPHILSITLSSAFLAGYTSGYIRIDRGSGLAGDTFTATIYILDAWVEYTSDE